VQVFNEINAREMEKLNVFAHTFDNWVFLVIITFTAIFQWIMVSFLGKLANTVPLTLNQWGITLGIGAASLVVAVIVKLIPVPSEKIIDSAQPQTNGSYQAIPHGEENA
jgi:Ca2+-transporting ATPase